MPKSKRAKKPPPKPRAVRGTGSCKWNARRKCWIWRVPVGRIPASGGRKARTKYREASGKTQAECVANAKLIRPIDPSAITVAEWAERWLAASGVGDSTRADYRHTLDTLVLPAIGPLRMAAVTTGDVDAMVAGWTIGPNTARKNLGQVKAMFEAARRKKVVRENVAADCKGPKKKKVQIDPFTTTELARIVAAGAADPADAAFGLQAAIGCRIGESMALNVEDWDRVANTVRITKTYTRKHGLRKPKTENGVRTVEVPAPAVACLAIAAGSRTSGPLFVAGGRRRDPGASRKRWRTLLKELGLRYRRPHQLRHSVATHTIAAGVHIGNVARDLGDTVKTIVETYCHATDGPGICAAMGRLLAAGNAAVMRLDGGDGAAKA